MNTHIYRRNSDSVTISLKHDSIFRDECDHLSAIFGELGGTFKNITIDMRTVTAVDPLFFLMLVRTIRDENVRVTLVDIKDHIRRIIELSRLYTLISVMPSAPNVAVAVESEVIYGGLA